MESELGMTGSALVFVDGVFLSSGYEHVHQSQPVVVLKSTRPGEVKIFGSPGSYRIESRGSTGTGTGEWEVREHFEIPGGRNHYTWIDPQAGSGSARIYRVVLEGFD